jgi:hypothetical protein
MIQTHNWLMMLEIAPEKLKQLVSSCYEYEEEMSYLESVNTISGRDISKIQILIQKIMTEYIKLIQQEEKDEEILKKIRNDMHSTLSNWFDPKGNIKDLSQQFLLSMEKGNLDFHVPLFATPSTGFGHARIYQSLVEAYKHANSSSFFVVEDLGKFSPEKNWKALGKNTYPELCYTCQRFEEYLEHLLKIEPFYNQNMLSEVYDRFMAVVEEYLKIVRNKDKIVNVLLNKTDFDFYDCADFVNSIYYYIIQSEIKKKNAFSNKFLASTKYKAGIMPEIIRDGKMGSFDGISLPPGPKE